MPPLVMRMARLAGKLALSLAIALLFGEALVRVLDPPTSRNTRPTNIYVPAPGALSYTLRPGFSGPAYGADVTINASGFRGPDIAESAPPGVRRLLLLGDSVVFGFGVEADQTLGSRLAEDLLAIGARVEVINLGVPGYNLEQQLEVWRQHGPRLAPDVVVIVLGRNDADPTIVRDLDRDNHSLGARVYAARRWLRSVSRLIGLLDHALWKRSMPAAPESPTSAGAEPDAPDASRRAAFVAAFRELASRLKHSGAPLVVAWYDPPAPLESEVATLSYEQDLPYVVLTSDFDEPIGSARWRLTWDPHPSADADATMARTLAAFLATKTPEALGLPSTH